MFLTSTNVHFSGEHPVRDCAGPGAERVLFQLGGMTKSVLFYRPGLVRVAARLGESFTSQPSLAMDAHNTFQQPQAVVPAPFSAKPGLQGLVLELPPKSIVVVGM
jgi:hypothetical protein